LLLEQSDDHMNVAGGKNLVCIRVLIADDQLRSRRSLTALLTAMRWNTLSYTEYSAYDSANRVSFPVEIVGEAQSGQETVEQVQALLPDAIVMDLQMHPAFVDAVGLDGLATIRLIKKGWPTIRIVVLTMFATDRTAALTAGADTFLLKGCPTSELLEAVMPGGATRLG
jgi:DNA-binding NarL/FixJ family response regulator